MSDTSTPRRWLITGASSGIGRQLTLAAVDRGDRVVASARNAAALDELCQRSDGAAIAVPFDVRDQAACLPAVRRAATLLGGFDVVVNSAGYGLFGAVETTTDEQARALFDTNVFGVLNVLRAALPVLRRQRRGHVLQMSSLFGQMSLPGTGVLAATKHALSGLTEALAAELAPLGIRFTLVEPGAIDTPFMARVVRTSAVDDYDETVGATLRRLTDAGPETVATPARIVAAMLAVVDSDAPPLHLALGGAAEAAIRAGLTDRLHDLDAWAAVTRAVDRAG